MPAEAKLLIDPDVLRTLHRIHRQRSDLKSQLRRGPMQIQAGQNAVNNAAEASEQSKQTLKRSKISADQKNLQLKSREQKVDDLKVKLNQAANNKEYQLLKDQIAADLQATSVLSDEILEALEQIDVLAADLVVREAALKLAESKQLEMVAAVQQRMQQAQQDLLGVDAELAETEKQLPSSFQKEYQRLIATRGEEALACAESGSCGGCYQTLTVQLIDIMTLKQLVNCPNCGALLYLPEDRVVR